MQQTFQQRCLSSLSGGDFFVHTFQLPDEDYFILCDMCSITLCDVCLTVVCYCIFLRILYVLVTFAI